ncbi:MAG: MBL fold metallo-hydrolase [Clostridiales bacterium]|nr:MBL fold metallo-hydrolase [Clostridiales bacterium]
MHIQTVVTGEIRENAYVLDNGVEAVVIDPGADYEKIRSAMGDMPCAAVLLTHAHFDHIGVAARFQRDGAKIYMHAADEKLLHGGGHLADLFGASLELFTPDVWVKDGDILSLCGETIHVIATPGHTDGSVCYAADTVLFSGDTLFYRSVGRTDFPSGDASKLKRSLQTLFAVEGDRTVLSGHGAPTRLSDERKNNPYV